MFYNARMYDPSLAFFVSADTVSPGKAGLSERNRYSYVLNNPLGLLDPSGHDPVDDDEDICGERATHDSAGCAKARATLKHFGFKLVSYFFLYELRWIIEAINDLLRAAGAQGYDFATFRNMIGLGVNEDLDYINLSTNINMCNDPTWQMCADRDARYLIYSREHVRMAHDGAVRDGYNTSLKDYFKYGIVHELAHLIKGRPAESGSVFTPDGNGVSDYANAYPKQEDGTYLPWDEDWAETVASLVYPGLRIKDNEGDHSKGDRSSPATNPATNMRKRVAKAYLRSFVHRGRE